LPFALAPRPIPLLSVVLIRLRKNENASKALPGGEDISLLGS
jgi:hypothetical protein